MSFKKLEHHQFSYESKKVEVVNPEIIEKVTINQIIQTDIKEEPPIFNPKVISFVDPPLPNPDKPGPKIVIPIVGPKQSDDPSPKKFISIVDPPRQKTPPKTPRVIVKPDIILPKIVPSTLNFSTSTSDLKGLAGKDEGNQTISIVELKEEEKPEEKPLQKVEYREFNGGSSSPKMFRDQ